MKSSIFVSRFIALATVLLLSQSAFALRVYNCRVNFVSNSSVKHKSVLLLAGQRSLISSDEMLLSIDLAIGSDDRLHALVPQGWVYPHREVIKDDIQNADFDSKTAKISVHCGQPADVKTVYMDRFTRRASLTPQLTSLFLGDARQAAHDFHSLLGVDSKIQTVAADGIRIDKVESQCLSGRGTNPDDYECFSYGMKNQTYRFANATSLPATESVCVQTKIVTGPPTGPGEDYSTDVVCAARKTILTRGL